MRVLILVWAVLFVGLPGAQAAVRCADVQKPERVRDYDLNLFLSFNSSVRAGEANANILSFYQANSSRLSLAGTVTLLRALRPAGPVPTTAPFLRHIPQDHAAHLILRSVLEERYSSLSARETHFLLEMAPSVRVREALEADFPLKEETDRSVRF